MSRSGLSVSCAVSLLAVCFGVVCFPAVSSAQGDDVAEVRPAMAALRETLSDGTVPAALRRAAPEAVGRHFLEKPVPLGEFLDELAADAREHARRVEVADNVVTYSGGFLGSLATLRGLDEATGSALITEAVIGTDYWVTFLQIGPTPVADADPAPDEEAVTALVAGLAEARRAADADAWLAAWDDSATAFLAELGSCIGLADYAARIEAEWERTGPQLDYELIAGKPLFRGDLCLLPAQSRHLNTEPSAQLFVLARGADGWRIVHLLAERPPPAVPVPILPPPADGPPGTVKPPRSPSFPTPLPLPMKPSRRNRPYIQGDVLVWQDNVIRGEDYDVWGFHIPTRQLYLINAPSPVSNQAHPAINDTRGYVVWTDDGTKLTGVDLYGIGLNRVTPVPFDAPLAAVQHPEQIRVGGQVLPRPRSDALTAEPGDQCQARMSGPMIVYVSKPGNAPQHLRIASLYRFPLASRPITGAAAVSPCSPDISHRWVVWQDRRNGNWDIYGYDLLTGREFPVCIAPGDQVLPRVAGDVVVWQDGRHDPEGCRGTAPPTVEKPADRFPVWMPDDPRPRPGDPPMREGRWWVYAADLIAGTQAPIGGYLGAAMEPDINGPVIVWREQILGDWEVWMMHMALPVPLLVTIDGLPKYQPAVWGNRIAWATRDGDAEVIEIIWWEATDPRRAGRTMPMQYHGNLLGRLVAVPGGSLYHRAGCPRLSGEPGVEPVTPPDIAVRSLRPCDVCRPPEAGG